MYLALRRTLGMSLLAVAAAPSGAAANEANGGAEVPDDPRISSVACVATAAAECPSNGALAHGAKVVIRGSELEATEKIVFLGKRGRKDDVSVGPTSTEPRKVEAVVPKGAATGRVTLASSVGKRATTKSPVRVYAPPPVNAAPSGKFFFDGIKRPRFSFEVSRPLEATVELVHAHDGSLVKSWTVAAEPGRANTVTWTGRGAHGASSPYQFRLVGEARSAASGETTRDRVFGFFRHIFPIRGKHNLGYTATNNFGGGGQRVHKGQDMFAKCGTPLAAARGGRVQYAGYHSAAGYYMVIDGRDTGVDYAYMHMLGPAKLGTGRRVRTGQLIGQVGESGRATGCHLHFEMWSGPGWYEGGSAFDPLPSLKAWDRFS